MANAFVRKTSRNIGTSLTAVNTYTVASSTQAVVIGLSVANVANGVSIEVSATLNDGATDTYLIKNAPLLPGATLVILGGDQKVVLVTGDSIKIASNTASSVDAVLSLLEMT